MGRRGSALLVTLVALVTVALALVLFHRHALDVVRLARASLASARAREAAGVGIAAASWGLGMAGTLPGGASWLVVAETTATGARLLWSEGRTSLPSRAFLELGAIVAASDTGSGAGASPVLLQRWVVMRR